MVAYLYALHDHFCLLAVIIAIIAIIEINATNHVESFPHHLMSLEDITNEHAPRAQTLLGGPREHCSDHHHSVYQLRFQGQFPYTVKPLREGKKPKYHPLQGKTPKKTARDYLETPIYSKKTRIQL